MFPSGEALRSSDSAGSLDPLFASFTAPMASSDAFMPGISGFGVPLSLRGSVRPQSSMKASQVPMSYVRASLGAPTPRGLPPLTITVRQMLPSTGKTASAPRMIRISLLNSPGHTYRCRRLVATLSSDNARLAEICCRLNIHITGLAPAILHQLA